jgi:hypothetical protein
LVEVQQTREHLVDKPDDHQLKIKQAFDKKVNKEDFQLGDLVLKWDIKASTVNLKLYGSALSKSQRYSLITPSSCRIWRMKRFLVVLSMRIF